MSRGRLGSEFRRNDQSQIETETGEEPQLRPLRTEKAIERVSGFQPHLYRFDP